MIKRITEYTIINCPYCFETDLTTLLINTIAPIGNKITLIFFRSGDRRKRFLENLRKDDGYILPVTLIEWKDGKTSVMVSPLNRFEHYGFLKTILEFL